MNEAVVVVVKGKEGGDEKVVFYSLALAFSLYPGEAEPARAAA